jgi:hypothetical protein
VRYRAHAFSSVPYLSLAADGHQSIYQRSKTAKIKVSLVNIKPTHSSRPLGEFSISNQSAACAVCCSRTSILRLINHPADALNQPLDGVYTCAYKFIYTHNGKMQVERKCSEKDAHYAFVRADCAPIKCGRRRDLFNLITFSGRHKSNRTGGRIAFVVMAPWLCTCIADCSAHKLKLCIRLTLSFMACCIALDPGLISLTGKIHQINKSKLG